jgi:hypothetical protein
MRCVDVAALYAAAIPRRNPDSIVMPFDDRTNEASIDRKHSILNQAERLAKYGGGGTNCALPLAKANRDYLHCRFAGCVVVSDYESWIGTGRASSTAVMTEGQARGRHSLPPSWHAVRHDPGAGPASRNVGGFSDAVFRVVAAFRGPVPVGSWPRSRRRFKELGFWMACRVGPGFVQTGSGHIAVDSRSLPKRVDYAHREGGRQTCKLLRPVGSRGRLLLSCWAIGDRPDPQSRRKKNGRRLYSSAG